MGEVKIVMKRNFFALVAVVLSLSLGLTACTGSGGKEPPKGGGQAPVKAALGVSTWIGYSPLAVAKEKGFFAKRGLDLTIQVMENVSDRRAAMAANRIQGFATTPETHIVTAASGVDVVQVLALDDSKGGDGIVAKKDINGIKDLKGKTVALQTGGGASFFFLGYLLSREGLSYKDLKIQPMTAGDAGAAFVAGKVDAAVTWEPWLSRAKATDFGKVLISSDQAPGIITDTIGLRKDFVAKHPEAVKALVGGWFEAVQLYQDKPDEALPSMAKFSGVSVDEMKKELALVKLFDQADNEKYFGGAVQGILAKAADLWLQEKIIDQKPDLNAMIDTSFLK